jgi:phosphopantetheine adenylyltransferase
MRKAIFPGSLIQTLGHEDIIKGFPFDEIVIAIGINAEKNICFPRRPKRFIEETFKNEPKSR